MCAKSDTDPVQIIGEWVSAITAHDFDRALTVMNDDAFLLLQSGDNLLTYEGKQAIKEALSAHLDGAQVRLLQPISIENGTVIWIEGWLLNDATSGSVEVAVRGEALVGDDGLIKSLIYTDTSENGLLGTPTGMPRAGIAGNGIVLWLTIAGGLAILSGSALRLVGRQRS